MSTLPLIAESKTVADHSERAAPVYFARNPLLFVVFELAESFGVSRAAIIGDIGLSPALLHGVGAKVPSHMLVDAVECAARKSGRCDFGLLLGERHDHRLFGPLGLLIEQAETFGEALALLVRYFHLYNSAAENFFIRQETHTLLGLNLLDKGKYESSHYSEAAVVRRVRFARLYLEANWYPSLVMFKHKRLASVETYERLLGPHVRFEQPMSAIAFTRAELGARAELQEPEVKRWLEAMLRDLEAQQSTDVRARVSQLIRNLLPVRRATVEGVAQAMGTTPRTLQRRLRAADLSFKGILADMRFEMAREYLRGGALTPAQIAPLLGLSESSALSRFLRDHAHVTASDLRSYATERE